MELFDVIFTNFQSSKKNVNRLLSAGILFVLVGHFFVVEPYFRYKMQERALPELLRDVRGASQGVTKTLNAIREEINGYPKHFKTVVLPAIHSSSEPSGAKIEIAEISLPLQEDKEKSARKYVEIWFEKLTGKLEKGVKSSVKEVGEGRFQQEFFEYFTKPLVTTATIAAKKAMKDFDDNLAELEEKNSKLWEGYIDDGGEKASQLLKKLVEKSFGPVEKELSSLVIKTEERLEKVKKGQQTLDTRLDSLLSSLGSVPVDLDNFVILFPLVIVMLVVMVTVALYRSVRLYIAFWREFAKDSKANDRSAFQQFTDCWYLPPYPSVIQPLLLIVLLVAITVMFVRADFLVINESELFSIVDDIQSLTKGVFMGVYVVGIIVIVACAWFVWKTLRRISQESIYSTNSGAAGL